MSEAVWVALVTGGCKLAATYITNKFLNDREDRRRAANVASGKALERIEELYKPLLDMIDLARPMMVYQLIVN